MGQIKKSHFTTLKPSLLDSSKVVNSQYLASGLDLWAIKSEKDLRDVAILYGIDENRPLESCGESTYLRVDYGVNGLTAAYECSLNKKYFKEDIPENVIGMPYHEAGRHTFSELIESPTPTGFSLGGPTPGIAMPYSHQLGVPFQLIAAIERKYEGMEWLPFDTFHIVYPLLTTIYPWLFIDYSNPEAPFILEDGLTFYQEDPPLQIPPSGVIEYKQIHLHAKPKLTNNSTNYIASFGNTGIPVWQQDFILPYCPVSGRLMKFVCGLDTCGVLPLEFTNIDIQNKYFKQRIAHLSFWGSGILNVFLEPETKIACFIVQDT